MRRDLTLLLPLAVALIWAMGGCAEPELEDEEIASRLHLRDTGEPAWVGVRGPLSSADLVSEARVAMDALLFARAEVMLERAAQLDRESGDPQFHNCMLHYQSYRFAEAERLCSAAIDLAGESPPYFYVLERGLVRVKLGELDGAEGDFLWCKQIDPANAEAYYDHSWVFAARGDVERTIAQVELAGQRDPVYTGREHVATDPPYQSFADDPRWKEFLKELATDAPAREEAAWNDVAGVAGVPQ